MPLPSDCVDHTTSNQTSIMPVSIILVFTDFTLSDHLVDLLQVDVRSSLVSRVSFLGCQVVERATKSQEVDLPLLKGFHLRFGPKNGEWHDSLLGFQVTFASPFHSDKNNQMCLCFPTSKQQICLLCAKVVTNKDITHKLKTSGGKKKQSLF